MMVFEDVIAFMSANPMVFVILIMGCYQVPLSRPITYYMFGYM